MYDLKWLQQAPKSHRYLYFWGHKPRADGVINQSCLSQWWPAPFTLDGITYATAEHYMMAQKAKLFHDDAIFQRIINSHDPKQAKALGRKVHHFDAQVWAKQRVDIVIRGNLGKFRQHHNIQNYLSSTGNQVLVEASPVDTIWGVGLAQDDARIVDPQQWRGLNLLGFALMAVREQL